MKYISTRGGMSPSSFFDVLLMGLAPDDGLVMPAVYPQVGRQLLNQWRCLSYSELAYQILRLYVDDIPADALKQLVDSTYTAETFGSEDITPLRTLTSGLRILGLSNGPTLAFKDMAMQLLGRLFEYSLTQRNDYLNILGATSGDTGSSAEYAMRGKQGIHVFMLSPAGKMSDFQRAQMYSLDDNNIHNIAIRGMFDDCQDIVKAVQHDAVFKQKYHIGTVNSINWARIVAQVVYYFKGYFNATQSAAEEVSFCVPSGNFGNVCAGHIARQMGLPIQRLIVATNENDVLDEFFQTGIYRPRCSAETYVTSSPSMDISKASNFERFVYDLFEGDHTKVCQLWRQLASNGEFDVSDKLSLIHDRFGFVSGKSTHQDRLKTISMIDQNDHQLIDPHTADAVKVAEALRLPGENVICLETALPVKFTETIQEAVGRMPGRPFALQHIENMPQHVIEMPVDTEQVKQYIVDTLD